MNTEKSEQIRDKKTDRSTWVPTNPDYDPEKPMQIGGQAVLEGVMMRAPGSVATAVRRANGSIVVKHQPFVSLVEKYRMLKLPVVRGAVGLIDMLYLGIQTLNWSGEIAMMDIEPNKAKSNGNGTPSKKNSQNSKLGVVLALVVALVVGIGVFFVTPLFVTTKLFHLEQDAFSFNLVAGGIRIAILLAYLAAISFMKDIRRLFQYHGGEHKAVFAFELKDELSPGVVLQRSRFHPRCGTSFLLIVMFVAIVSFAFLDLLVKQLAGTMTLPLRLLTHLPFIPVVGGLSYEIIRFSAKHSTSWWGRILIAPGLWLQRITTKEPDASQVEVALVALRCALGLEDPARYPLQPVASSVNPPSAVAGHR
ncbi:MAG TPA: DUF1385 domain-containing protein [Bacteroidota bacterium]|nr:DUF1385 domain-containing protein [Bacteroidota bacterium]